MSIKDGKLIFFHGVSEGNVDKKIPTIEYNNRMVYDCFNNPFTAGFGIPALDIPPINIYNRPHPHKISRYIPYLLPATIYVVSENSVNTFTNPSDSPRILPLTSDYPNPPHTMKKDDLHCDRVKIWYGSRKHDEKYIKIQGSIAPCALIKTRNLFTAMRFPGLT